MIKPKSLLKGVGNHKITNIYYDNWSNSYDATLNNWNYRAPKKVSMILKSYLSMPPKNILDIACGTGLFAEKILKFFPQSSIDGLDISRKILNQARNKKIYRKLSCSNFDKKLILDQEYDVVSLIGAMTYSENPKKLILKIHDLTKPRGFFIFTHRNDLWKKQNFSNLIESLLNKWKKILISRPLLYSLE